MPRAPADRISFGDPKDGLEVVEVLRILAHALSGGVGNLGHGLAVDLRELHNDVERRDSGEVVREVRADAERGFGPSIEMVEDVNGLVHGEAIRKDELLRAGIDVQGLVVLDHLVTPHEGIARVVADAIVELGEVEVEVTEEGIDAERIGQCIAKVSAILVNPCL